MDDYYQARQHLNLSEFALNIIENDEYIFLEKPSQAKMLNTIFSMYRDYADASIGTACARFREQLEKRVEAIPESTAKDATISALVESYRDELIKKSISYPREHPFKFQLDKENYKYITAWHDTEKAYGDIAGRYIKAVLEEYTRKPFIEREAIIYRDLIETVNACVGSHLSLILLLNSGNRYEVRPYGIFVDRGNNYHYLAGYSRKAGEKGEDNPRSFRISNIRNYKMYYGRSGRITEHQRKEIEHRINSAGVQFLLQEPDVIRVKLTKRGKAMYESQLHLRPPFIARTESSDATWIYDFSCTQAQAQFYFFKFGPEAEVLYPPHLRTIFISQYANAIAQYKKMVV